MTGSGAGIAFDRNVRPGWDGRGASPGEVHSPGEGRIGRAGPSRRPAILLRSAARRATARASAHPRCTDGSERHLLLAIDVDEPCRRLDEGEVREGLREVAEVP